MKIHANDLITKIIIKTKKNKSYNFVQMMPLLAFKIKIFS